ncbi:protein involved in polysaccharide export with SLBB domain [Tamilnaduibacter salinus]|uniref:Protein involved in polysaccharide export with SLBB domain n=1 Tax=Tamilnaduibacter salinus TaxID=1484056 RepID=A0A2U1CUQ0_9GAMM|nr:SLBB domain-containing protein [Tamilnaduibacter salinus]PVY70812.1 protein involved in polysaccharide export with SLBB domain [Tamilnaduibacter salinus]
MNRLVRNLVALSVTVTAPFAGAQSLSQSQIDRFMSLPQAQQEALAEQYGVDLENLREQTGGSDQPEEPPQPVVKPLAEAESEEESGRSDSSKPSTDDQGEAQGSGEDSLEPYGYELFAGAPSTFAPVTEIPMPSDYVIGPGDVVRVQLYGKKNAQFELAVNRDGNIEIPEIGPHNVAGQTFRELQANIKNLISESFIGVRASVSLGELRSMRIFVLGEARTPGAYTVSSLSTITNALFVSGGVQRSGSLRRIKHKRDGEVIGELDLYDLLLDGDTSDDARLQPGDVIFIPPVGPRVGISGEVYRPALYELDGATTVEQAVQLAGGMTAQAYPQITRIERTNDDYLRVIAEANLTKAAGRQMAVQPGDRISIAAISDITGQYVEVKGAATRTGRFAWVPGMRISSLFTSLDASLMPVADKRYAAVVRTDPDDDTISVINVRLRNAVQNPGSAADIQLQEKDQLLVFSDAGKVKGGEEGRNFTREQLFNPVLRRLKAQAGPGHPQQTVSISGPVRYPGEYPMPASHAVRDAIWVAGGLKDSASLYAAEIARYETPEQGSTETRIIEINLKTAMNGNGAERLQSRDRLLVKRIPEYARQRTVSLEGEIEYPGEYTFRKGESLQSVIRRAGGLTDNAFPRGAVFTREDLKRREAQRLKEAEERLKGDLLGQQLQGEDFGNQANADSESTLEDLLDQVQDARPVGRMVIDLQAVLNEGEYQSIRLQDGDTLTVPEIPQSVSVFGEVQFPTSHLHKPGLTAEDYIDRSGGPTAQADEDRVYVVKADGSVILPEDSNWFGGTPTNLGPGDTIIMPIDVDRISQLKLWTNVSQIVYQIALGAAAVGNL